MPIQKACDFFVEQEKILASMQLACGKISGNDVIISKAMAGIQDESGKPVDDSTIYDLASLTKLFTGVLTELLIEEGDIDLSAKIRDYAPQFTELDASVRQILGFMVPIRTQVRIDSAADAEEASRALFSARVCPEKPGDRRYSDMHSMVLRYVIEAASGKKYMQLLREKILEPLEMKTTFASVPEDKLPNLCSYNNEHRISGSQWICRSGMEKGVPHDPKAAVMQGKTENVAGHAGIFSTMEDMIKLARGLLEEKIISQDRLKSMAKNNTGRQLPDGTHTQYLGCQCYVRHPVQYFSEIPLYMSDSAIGLSGFTGNHISIDPEKKIFTIMLGNRVMNRLTAVTPESRITEIGLSRDGRGKIRWKDGTEVISSVNYVHLKDEYMHSEVQKELEQMG